MKTNGKAFKTCCVAEKSFFYRPEFIDGLGFVPVNCAVKLIIAWLSDIFEKLNEKS